MSESNQDKVDIEDIQAEVSKHHARLVFGGIILFMCLLGFFVKTCADMPAKPSPPDPSIECAKIPGAQWVPVEFKVVDGHTQEIPAYCSTKKIQQ
jgi:hypothetical protein